jgi:hypothetical protein
VSLALTAAFLFAHRPELAYTGAGLAALTRFIRGHGLVEWRALAESLGGLAVAAAIVIAWYGVGALILRAIERWWPGWAPLPLAMACALGAGAWSLTWFFLGLAGCYVISVAVGALALGLTLAVAAVVKGRRQMLGATAPGGSPSRHTVVAPATLTAIALIMAATAALAPPTAKDTLQYHIALPKAFIEAHRLMPVGDSIAAYFPLGAELNGMWAMLLGRVMSERVGEAAFGATAFAWLPLLLAFVAGWAAERANAAWAMTAAALVATVPVIYDVASSGYVDLALALYLALAVRAAARWCVGSAWTELPMFALALGFALGVKVTAMFPVLLLGLVVLLGARRAGHRLPVTALAIAAAAMVGAPWYVRTWRLTGSPFFPYFLDIWPGDASGWDATRSVMIRVFNSAYGGDKSVLGYLVLPVRLSLMGQRDIPALYENVLGVAFLIAIPLLVWALWCRRLGAEAGVVTGVAATLFVWWAASAQVLRYLIPVVPLAAVVAVRAAVAVAGGARAARWLRATLLVPAGASLLVGLTWFLSEAPMMTVLGAEPRDTYLSRRLDHYPYYRLIDAQLPRDARVWLIGVRRDTYYLERPYVGDYLFEDYTLRRHLEQGYRAEDLRRWAREAGITHVFVRHDLFFDARRSSLVDDRLPEEENVKRLTAFRDFLLEGTHILAADQKFLLVALR